MHSPTAAKQCASQLINHLHEFACLFQNPPSVDHRACVSTPLTPADIRNHDRNGSQSIARHFCQLVLWIGQNQLVPLPSFSSSLNNVGFILPLICVDVVSNEY